MQEVRLPHSRSRLPRRVLLRPSGTSLAMYASNLGKLLDTIDPSYSITYPGTRKRMPRLCDGWNYHVDNLALVPDYRHRLEILAMRYAAAHLSPEASVGHIASSLSKKHRIDCPAEELHDLHNFNTLSDSGTSVLRYEAFHK